MADLLAHCYAEISGAPEWVHLIPAGEVLPYDGREPWANDNPEKVIELSLARGTDMVIDFEHQTDRAPMNGQPAPAAGWIKELENRADGIWGRVEWTAKATAMLDAKEYRYISPTFTHTKSRGVVMILRAALTNNPALTTLTALASAENGDDMDELLQRLAALLGVTGEASETAICSAITGLNDKIAGAEKVTNTIAQKLNLQDDASEEDFVTALASATQTGNLDPSKFVPMDQFMEVSKSLKVMQDTTAMASATSAVDSAVSSGKIPPAQKEWATNYAIKDPDGFKNYVSTAPVLASGTQLPGTVNPDTGLTDSEIATCNATGVSIEDFKKSKEGDVT